MCVLKGVGVKGKDTSTLYERRNRVVDGFRFCFFCVCPADGRFKVRKVGRLFSPFGDVEGRQVEGRVEFEHTVAKLVKSMVSMRLTVPQKGTADFFEKRRLTNQKLSTS